jgi:hypothetical protein
MVSVNIFVGNKIFLLNQHNIFIRNLPLVNANGIYQTTKAATNEIVEQILNA